MAELKILLITRDTDIFADKSESSERMRKWGEVLTEVHIVVLCPASPGFKDKQISNNVWAHPVNSSWQYFSANKAASLGKKLVYDHKFTRGKSVIIADDVFDCAKAGIAIRRRWKLPLEVDFKIDPNTLGFWQAGSIKSMLKNSSVVGVETKGMANIVSRKFHLDKNNIVINQPYIDVKRIEDGKITFDLRARYGWHLTMLAVGSLTKAKNFSMAIRVLAKVRSYFPDTGLVIVGSGPEKAELESLAKSLDMKPGVVFVDRTEDISTYYKTANLFIETSEFESFGQELVEAGVNGLPIVTTPVGFALELEPGKEAIICPQRDEEYMFKAIYDLIGNNQLRESLRQNIKTAINTKLLSEEDNTKNLLTNWNRIATMIKAS